MICRRKQFEETNRKRGGCDRSTVECRGYQRDRLCKEFVLMQEPCGYGFQGTGLINAKRDVKLFLCSAKSENRRTLAPQSPHPLST